MKAIEINIRELSNEELMQHYDDCWSQINAPRHYDRGIGARANYRKEIMHRLAQVKHPSDEAIRSYMHRNLRYFIDGRTLEVNATFLAEDAANHFEDYAEDNASIDEHYFEIAADIARDHEERMHKRHANMVELMDLE